MKILIVGVEQIKKDERYMDDKGWSFKRAFDKNGIETELFIYKKKGRLSFLEKDKLIRGKRQAYMNNQLVRQVRQLKPDVLLILKGETIYPETLLNIRKKTDTLIVTVFPDNPLYMGKFESIEPCHYFFVKDSYVHDALHKVGLKNVMYLPQCTDPDVHRPMELPEEDRAGNSCDLSLIGSMYPYRLKFIEQLVDFQPVIWGRGWSKSMNKDIEKLYRKKDIRGTSKAKAISGSAVSLNPHHPLNDINGVNRRTFDIAACKGFQLADLKQDMHKILKVEEEIICFESMDQLKKLIRYYLNHPDERIQIAEAAYQKVIKEHTYDVRAKQILEIVSGR